MRNENDARQLTGVQELGAVELNAVLGGHEADIVFAKAREHLNGADLWNVFVGCAGVPGAAMSGANLYAGGGCPR